MSTRWRSLNYPSKVNVIAAFAALLVFCGASVALLSESIPEKRDGKVPGETTRTTTRTNEAGADAEGETEKRVRSEVIEENEPVEQADESLLGRALDNSAGVIIFRLGLALLAAFIFGLVVQQVLLGRYGLRTRA
jgi:hypothetical protein